MSLAKSESTAPTLTPCTAIKIVIQSAEADTPAISATRIAPMRKNRGTKREISTRMPPPRSTNSAGNPDCAAVANRVFPYTKPNAIAAPSRKSAALQNREVRKTGSKCTSLNQSQSVASPPAMGSTTKARNVTPSTNSMILRSEGRLGRPAPLSGMAEGLVMILPT